jgi:endonuclease/exonuclease/phosphatase family metal-dependent hydrolase
MDIIKRIFHNVIFILCILASAITLLADLAVYINPIKFWYFALLGLAFPYLLFIVFCFCIYYALLRKKWGLIPLITILLSWSNITSTIQFSVFSSNVALQKSKKEIKIMSYNVRGFNKYSWIERLNVDISILGLIKEEDPDIVCFQEFYNARNKKWQYKIKSWFRPKKFYKTFYKYAGRDEEDFGIAVFSKYPILKSGQIEFDNSGNTSMYVDLKIKKDTVRLFNNHLQSYQFIKENYDFIDTIGFQSNDKQAIKKISIKLRDAYKLRAEQAQKIVKQIKKSPYPVIVCGDFNDTPVSYTYQKIANGLEDSFIESGSGLGCTFNGFLHILRIDYILTSPEYHAIGYKTIPVDYSDHFPVICRLIYKN